jgi:hypothetical protein
MAPHIRQTYFFINSNEKQRDSTKDHQSKSLVNLLLFINIVMLRVSHLIATSLAFLFCLFVF